MTIEITNLVPLPLRDKVQGRSSEVWNQSVSFKKSEWVKIKAPSGTGKTTLIHMLYKLRRDYTGHVSYDGTDIRNLDAEKMATIRQSKLSVIFQDLRLFPYLTAFENIQLKRLLQTPYCDESRVYEMAEMLGVRHVLSQNAGICSYGEQQRISIIRALVQPFDILLMDEPFSHLDEGNTAKAAALIAEECIKRGAGFVLTDLDEDRNFNYTRYLNL
jgi:ABC-type lipoprotein export system ATPase subunit